MSVMLMANPRVEAANIVQQFFVTNPRILITMIDLRNRLRVRLDEGTLPKLKNMTLWSANDDKDN
jgi:hypothetical protein